MQNVLLVIQIIVSILLIGLVVVQSKGTGLGRAFGGGTNFSRRGFEKVLFKLTFFTATLFVVVSVILIFS